MRRYVKPATGLLFCAMLAAPIRACDLCAIYSADNARGSIGSGFLVTVSEQYVSSHTLQVQGEPFTTVPFLSRAYVDSSYTHLVPGYNFSSRVGISLNAPLIYRDFRRTEILTTAINGKPFVEEQGTISGLGDVALVGRVSLVQKVAMEYTITVNLLAGVKFPTGDTDRLDAEVVAAKEDLALFGPGHAHGTIGGVHQHDLSLGSGSYDGVFGVTSTFRWDRWFFNSQAQYYLRTEARGYEFGDMAIVSGGPGAYVSLGKGHTLSVQANAFYEYAERDKIIGQAFDQTGGTAWYFGPLINLTLGSHFSANAGVDIPLSIDNHGLQTVPDYRIHGGVTWRF